jgi:hypothetical protein
VRKNLTLSVVAVLALGACSSGSSSSQADATATPAPLVSCETRQIQIDGADIELDANVDATLGKIVVIDIPPTGGYERIFADLKKAYGDPKPDPRTTTRPWRLGLTRETDMCGRPLSTGSPSPSPSP